MRKNTILFLSFIVVIVGSVLVWQQLQKPVEDKTSVDDIVNWQTYRNEQYGFEFSYPEYFDEFQFVKSAKRNIDPYINGKLIQYRDEFYALVSLEALPNTIVNPSRYLKINIFPLDSYVFNNSPNGVDYGYNATIDKWWERPGNLVKKDTELDSIKGNGWDGYMLSLADMFLVIKVIAIPNIEKNIMIEVVSRATYPPEQGSLNSPEKNPLVELKGILSTFKFLEELTLGVIYINLIDYREFSLPKYDYGSSVLPSLDFDYGSFIINELPSLGRIPGFRGKGVGVEVGSIADKAGLKEEDLILEINNEKVLDLNESLPVFKTGKTFNFKILRSSEEIIIPIEL